MSLFFNSNSEDDITIVSETAGMADVFIADELSRVLTEAELKEFLQSEECESLVEAGLMRRNTVVRLSKTDDFERRKRLAALQIAKNKKDPLVKLLSRTIKKKYEIMDRIYAKNKALADRVAKQAQKAYIKKVPMLNAKIPGLDTTKFKKS